MKKPFYYLLLLFAALLFVSMASCSEDKDEPEIKNETDVKDESEPKDEPEEDDSFTFPTDVSFLQTMEGVWLGEQDMSFMIFTTTNWPQSFGYNRSAVKWGDLYFCVSGDMAGIPVRDGDHYNLSQSSGLFHNLWITDYDGKKITMKNFRTDETKSFVYSQTAGIGRVCLTKMLPCGFKSSVKVTVKVYANNSDDEPGYTVDLGEMSGYPDGSPSAPFWLCGQKVVAYFIDCKTDELLEVGLWTDLEINTVYNLNY